MVVLVGGSATRDVGSGRARKVPREPRLYEDSLAPVKKARAPVVQKAREVSPEHVIPMDEKDFKDF